jgi:hypothetical protein
MSTTSPPTTVNRPINFPSPDDEADLGVALPQPGKQDDLDEMPQEVLTLLIQLLPTHENVSELSLQTLRSRSMTDLKMHKSPVDQAMHLSQREQSAHSPLTIRSGTSEVELGHAANTKVLMPEQSLPAQRLTQPSADLVTTSSTPDLKAVTKALSLRQMSASGKTPLVDAPFAPERRAGHSEQADSSKADVEVPIKLESAQPLQQLLSLPDKLQYETLTAKQSAFVPTPRPMLKPRMGDGNKAHNYLQVPFNRGDASGLITIDKGGSERPEHLFLSSNSASVFSYLSDNLGQITNPRWHLADQQRHEQHHGQEHGFDDDDTEEDKPQMLKREGRTQA